MRTDAGFRCFSGQRADGGDVLPNLPIGPYRVEVGTCGLTSSVQTGVVLAEATHSTIDVQLKAGAVSEQVEVQAKCDSCGSADYQGWQLIENQRILDEAGLAHCGGTGAVLPRRSTR